MTDPRPSENTDPIQLPGMRAAGFFDDVPTLGKDFFTEPADDERDPIADLIERAQNANDPGFGLVLAQLATVRAVQAQTEQMRLANRIAVGQFRIIPEGTPPFRHLIAEPRNEYDVALHPVIREGLDL